MSGTRRIPSIMAALAGTALLAGCDDISTGASRTPEVSLSFTTSATASTGAAGVSAAAPLVDDAGRTLTLDRVQLLVAEVELKRLDHDECDDAMDEDACEKFRSGPLLVDLPLGGGVVTPFTDPITPDTYEELELEIDEPEDDDGARARFAAAHPDWPRKATVRVSGSFDAGSGAQPFDLFLEIDAEIEREFAPPLVVDASTDPAAINLTVDIAVAEWFRDRGGNLIDPRALTADSELLDLVEENVEQSFRAFEDDDRDGCDDADDDDDDDSGRDHTEDDR